MFCVVSELVVVVVVVVVDVVDVVAVRVRAPRSRRPADLGDPMGDAARWMGRVEVESTSLVSLLAPYVFRRPTDSVGIVFCSFFFSFWCSVRLVWGGGPTEEAPASVRRGRKFLEKKMFVWFGTR